MINTMHQAKNMNVVVENPDFQQALSPYIIKVVAPASAATADPDAMAKIASLPNLRIEIPLDLIADKVAYHANTDEARLKSLKAALLDKAGNTIVWTLRGGYGSARLLDGLKKLSKPKYEKIFIGFSDVTAIHLFLSQKWQWKTIHGAGLVEVLDPNKDPGNLQKIADWISTRSPVAHLLDLQPVNAPAKKAKKIMGRLTGGNLSIVQTSVGTHWQIKTAGKIIFLEDVKEKGYRIDRTLYHLKQAGIFKKAKAIILGDFIEGDEHVNLALTRFASDIKVPVFKSDHFGHGRINHPLIYNAKSEIVLNKLKKFDLIMR